MGKAAHILALMALASGAVPVVAADPSERFVYPGKDGRLVYPADAAENRVPDFSHAGYGGGAAIPDVPVRAVVRYKAGDATARIQAAIDAVAERSPDANGFRGAVLLAAGRHEVAGQLRLTASGVVLRGVGTETVLAATGTDRRTVIRVLGKADRSTEKARVIADKYVPVGATKLRLDSADGLEVGDAVQVDHPSTKEWIAAVGMDDFPARDDRGSYLDWKPGTVDLRWDRVVTKVDGDTITLDAPLTTALDTKHGTCSVREFSWPGRVRHVGIENLRVESAFDPANPKDENHAWTGITVENAADVWVRQVSFRHLAGSAVAVWETAARVTVQDCGSVDPVSEVGGFRRHTFLTAGQQTLFLRCTADHGRHDFAVGHLAAGPTAFVRCTATNAHKFSGPIGSWASGVLYDNVNMDGGGLALTNRETDDQGTGWAAANSVLWQCVAPVVTCRAPPTAQNWAIGVWGQLVGDGHWRQFNEFVKPESLYEAQLRDRLGAERAQAVIAMRTIPTDGGEDAKEINEPATPKATAVVQPLALTNGWLTVGGRVVAGGSKGTVWWQGHTLPARAGDRGVGVTRFVPGRDGPGFTDDLTALATEMKADGTARLEHHWGLWYDRRRDDHQMVRRMDGDVWPPFYEQPWSRSGTGTAWDGLSKYDLTKFNPWYFARLKGFADECNRTGRVLVQQMYFQHNILEAGAHWADFPWRPANCVQETGFPEPPGYVGGKRVFMAEAFYDVSHPVRRDLHRRYIRHCLDTLGGCPNVVFQVGEEFTGPKTFVELWLDTVAEWQTESRKKVLVGLSCTKDTQDAVLADPKRAPLVSVIDLKYWWYTADGGVYDPKGGENLAPRQHLREWKGSKSCSDESVARAVREYRTKYPDKAVTVSLEDEYGWAAVAAGGSAADLPKTTDDGLLAAVPKLKPFESASLTKRQYALAEPGERYLVFSADGGAIDLDLSGSDGSFTAAWVNRKSGVLSPLSEPLRGGGVVTVKPVGPKSGSAVLWVCRPSK